jgi:hypothetical protein
MLHQLTRPRNYVRDLADFDRQASEHGEFEHLREFSHSKAEFRIGLIPVRTE